ncbi:MAG: hypothetical protein LBC58_01695, partial [Clostridiales Family XIII bacterium]|nr:hypothetical protein [Clostridiales Family XIII bacterium]
MGEMSGLRGRRVFAALLALIVVLAGFAGCREQNSPGGEEAPAQAAETAAASASGENVAAVGVAIVNKASVAPPGDTPASAPAA